MRSDNARGFDETVQEHQSRLMGSRHRMHNELVTLVSNPIAASQRKNDCCELTVGVLGAIRSP